MNAFAFLSRYRRWSDHDRRIGPFTYARDTYGTPFGLVLDSGGCESAGCHLRLRGFGHTVLIELPALIKPGMVQDRWDPGPHSREYGFELSGDSGHDFLRIFFGAQTGSSSTSQMWSCFLPWMDWRHVRCSLFDNEGAHFWTEWDRRGELRDSWQARQAVGAACPSVVFEFDDFDGKRIQATTRIQEREWRRGTKWCRWLSWFSRPRIRRSLDITFSEEVGPGKGSWKGGTLGHGIEMLPGETHEGAFRRYCEQDHISKYRKFRLTFVGKASDAQSSPH